MRFTIISQWQLGFKIEYEFIRIGAARNKNKYIPEAFSILKPLSSFATHFERISIEFILTGDRNYSMADLIVNFFSEIGTNRWSILNFLQLGWWTDWSNQSADRGRSFTGSSHSLVCSPSGLQCIIVKWSIQTILIHPPKFEFL